MPTPSPVSPRRRPKTAAELLRLYLKHHILRPNSVIALQQTVGHFGSSRLVNQATLSAFVRRRLANGVSPRTVGPELIRLRGLWQCGFDAGVMPPVQHVPMPRTPRLIINTTPMEQLYRLLVHCQKLKGFMRLAGRNMPYSTIPMNVYWPAFVVTAYDTGLRTSDLLQLRWEEGKTSWVIHLVKTSNPKTIKPNPETLRWLKRLAAVSENLLDLGWCRWAYAARLKRIAAQVGVTLTPQQLRRSSISEVEKQRPGAGPWHAGHASDGTTRTWYFDHSHIWGDVRGPRPPQ